MGHELDSDLCILCKECHKEFHKRHAYRSHKHSLQKDTELFLQGRLPTKKEVKLFRKQEAEQALKKKWDKLRNKHVVQKRVYSMRDILLGIKK